MENNHEIRIHLAQEEQHMGTGLSPLGRKLVKHKWLFKNKFADDSSPLKYKEIFVAKGYSQLPGIDSNETFAPVAKMDSIRLALVIAASK